MNGKIKSHGTKVSIAVIVVMLVTAAPVGYIMADSPFEPEHQGQAEGIGLTAAAAATVAGTAIGVVSGYQVNDFFSDGQSATEEQVEGAIDDATNDTLREATHSSAIISEGSNEGFLDNVDNDQATIEGQVEQMVNSKLIKNGDDYTTQSELVQDAEERASTYMNTRQTNFLETHRFHTLSLKQYDDQLETAGYGSDVRIKDGYSESQAVEVSSAEELGSAVDSSYSGSVPTSEHVKLTSDITYTSSDNGSLTAGTGDLHVNLNGNTLTTNGDFYWDGGVGGGSADVSLINGELNQTSGASSTFNFIRFGSEWDTIDITLDDVQLNPVNDSDYQITVNGYSWTNTVNIYDPDDRNIPFDSDNGAIDNLNRVDYPANSRPDVTFDPTEIANANTNLNESEVPLAEFEHNNETVTLPAKNVTLSQAYMGANNTVQVAVPYDASDGTPIDYTNGETVIIGTPTSGISGYAEPVDFPRAFDILTTTDDVASTTYNSIQTYAEQVWTDYLSDIALDDSKSVYDNSSISKELGTLTYGSLDPSSPEQALNLYTGSYEGTTATWTDVIHVKELSSGDTHVGALYSTNMTALMEQTPNTDKVEEGDTFNVSTTDRTFVLNQETAEKNVLEGEVEVTLIEGKESADVRDYEMDSTNLAEQAQRLQDASETAQQTADNPGTYVPDLGGNTMLILGAIGLLIGVAILRD